jgi:hypothetical protein
VTQPPAVTVSEIHRSFLVWRNSLYARQALALSALSILLYWWHRPTGTANGGSFLGYSLGVLALALVVWLAWFGIRRRRYGGTGLLEGILSAHVYFGLALIVVATLHTGFHFHWNVHTLAFALLVLVVASGIFGAYGFWRYPELMTRNRAGMTLGAMTAELATLDLRCRKLALAFPDEIVAIVTDVTAPEATAGLFRTIRFGRRREQVRRLSLAAISRVQRELVEGSTVTPTAVLPLVQSLTQRLTLLERLYRDRQFRVLMLQWRAVHVPLTVALLVALLIHVIVVFYDW